MLRGKHKNILCLGLSIGKRNFDTSVPYG
jgi:hypothetical protein